MENIQTFKDLFKLGKDFLYCFKSLSQFRRKLYLLMAISFISANLSAEEFIVDDILYNVLSSTDYTVEVAAYQNPSTSSVTIPNTISYDGKTWKVVAIGDLAFSEYNPEVLQEITIGDNVKRIGAGAFSGCRNLERVYGCASVESIGLNAFKNCSSLKSTISSSSLTEIGDYAYRGCTSLKAAVIGENVESIGVGVYSGCTGIERLNVWQRIEIPDEFCYNCTNLEIVYFETPYNALKIGRSAFEYCSKLQQFGSSSGLQSLSGLSGTTEIGSLAFRGCTNLRGRLSLKASIGQMAFMNCEKITYAYIQSGSVVGDDAFAGTGIETLIVSTNNIGSSAFSYCKSLTTATMTGLSEIPREIFSGCDALTTLSLPSSYSSIGESAFRGCSSLAIESFEIPKEVSSIGNYAFEGCSGIKSMVFNGSLPEFGTMASTVLYDCTQLTDIYFPAFDYSSYNSAAYLKTGYVSYGSNVDRTLHPQIKLAKEWNSYCATGTFWVPDGIEAYIVKSVSGSSVYLKQVSVINSGQGVILKPLLTNTAYNVDQTTEQAYDINLLVGTTTSTDLSTPEEGYTNFILYNGEFRKTTGTISAFKAYLPLPNLMSNARSLNLVVENETTNIKNVSNDSSENVWYDLNGVRFENTPAKKGIYIHNGKLSIKK